MTDGQFRDIARRTMTPRSIAIQVVGFAIGVAIVAWIVKGALEAANAPGRAGIMESVSAAWQSRPWLVAGIAITTVLSLVIDGALFWLVLLPVRRLSLLACQCCGVGQGVGEGGSDWAAEDARGAWYVTHVDRIVAARTVVRCRPFGRRLETQPTPTRRGLLEAS